VRALLRVFTACALAILALAAAAQDSSEPAQPVLRFGIQPEKVAVGEAAQLKVTVLGPTWFPTAPVFPSFEIPNAVVRLPPNSSRSTSDLVDGERWNGVTRNYQIFPLIGATYRLGGETVRVTVANPGAASMIVDLAVPEVKLVAEVPAGAEGLVPYISGSRFDVRREIDGETVGLEAGDALVVRYIAELDGLPAMFLPPVAPEIESRTVSVYADEPVLSEGALSTRTEQITLVMNYGGEVVLPAVTFQWWNRETDRLETVSIDALNLLVSGPVVEAERTEEPAVLNWRVLTLVVLALAAVVYLLRRFLPPIRRWFREERVRYLDSEPYAFDRLRKACKTQDPRAIYVALLEWQQKLWPESELRQFAEAWGDQNLIDSIDALSGRLFAEDAVEGSSDTSATFSSRKLAGEAALARDRFLAERAREAEAGLPGLNPR